MQVGDQIAFQAEDNRRFAQSILVDEQPQYLLEENVKGMNSAGRASMTR